MCAKAGVQQFKIVIPSHETVQSTHACMLFRAEHASQPTAQVASQLLTESGASDVTSRELPTAAAGAKEWLDGVTLIFDGLEDGAERELVEKHCVQCSVPRIECASQHSSAYFRLSDAPKVRWPPKSSEDAQWLASSSMTTVAAQMARSAMKLCLQSGEIYDSYLFDGVTNITESTRRNIE